jgi:hypothetical protein
VHHERGTARIDLFARIMKAVWIVAVSSPLQ